MHMGMIGLGRMGANMVRRLLAKGHGIVVNDRSSQAMEAMADAGALVAADLDALAAALEPPRVIWLMVPAAVVEGLAEQLSSRLSPGDVLIDGGNSHYKDDIARAKRFGRNGIHYLDVGTSGGVWGLERGYCLMIGGDAIAVERASPIFQALAPGFTEPRTGGRQGEPAPAEQGWLHCGPSGAGHFVKMVHNGIEYGLMAAYAEGLNLLRHADVGNSTVGVDAETAPMADPGAFRYDIDVAEVAEVWRRGSVIGSWLLDLTADALQSDPDLSRFQGRVSDSGEGRWTAIAAVESGTPVPVLATALFGRFSSRGEDDFADRVLSGMRAGFGGHGEKSSDR
ncbi:MAG: decarboxylating 6-phosphogluconate dehydrogenase [Chromatiales bacterium]|nr:decarboxylating 6-phosphogluconate dehydrogenase [Chromatiales bacterium]